MARLSIDINNTKAILIGINNYTYLRKVPCAGNNIQDFAALLMDPQILGLPTNSITTIEDKRNDEILEALIDFINDEENTDVETLILYYIGHGLRDRSNKELYLTGCNSRNSSVRVSAIPYNDIKALIENSQIQNRIIFIDSCHSGLAALGEDLQVFTEIDIDIKGSFTLTSAAEEELSFFDPETRNSFFTGQLLNVIRSGTSQEMPYITLEDIYSRLRRKLTASSPQRKSNLSEYNFNAFKNPKYSLAAQRERDADNFFKQNYFIEAKGIYLELFHNTPSPELSNKVKDCTLRIELIEKIKSDLEQERIAKENESEIKKKQEQIPNQLTVEDKGQELQKLEGIAEKHQNEEVNQQDPKRQLATEKTTTQIRRVNEQDSKGEKDDQKEYQITVDENNLNKKLSQEKKLENRRPVVETEHEKLPRETTKSNFRILSGIIVAITCALLFYYFSNHGSQSKEPQKTNKDSTTNAASPTTDDTQKSTPKLVIRENDGAITYAPKIPMNTKLNWPLHLELYKDHNGETVDWDKVKQYILQGADINTCNYGPYSEKKSYGGQTAIEIASTVNRLDVVKFLLAHHADIGSAVNDAIRTENYSIAEYLVAHGGSFKKEDLFMAVKNGNQNFIDMILKSGVSINSTDEAGRNCLFYIFFGNYYLFKEPQKEAQLSAMLSYIAQKGVNLNKRDIAGNNVLHYATAYNLHVGDDNGIDPDNLMDVKLVSKLIKLGLDVNAKNNDGKTPLAFAMGDGLAELMNPIRDVLKSNGAIQ